MSWRNRLRALERHLDTLACRSCGDHPVRIVSTDPETGQQWYADAMPETECPACGRPAVVINIESPEPIDLAKI